MRVSAEGAFTSVALALVLFLGGATGCSGGGGGGSGGTTAPPAPPNQDPVVGNDFVTTVQSTPIIIDVLLNDFDPEGDALTIVDVTSPSGGTAIINAGATISYSPGPGFVGTDPFMYTVEDSAGNRVDGTVTVTVLPAGNDPPIAGDDTDTTPEDTAIDVTVLANDMDPDGDPLSVVSVTDPPSGTAVVNPGDTITYTPDADYFGPDAFDYTIEDPFGASATATVTITVTAVNDPPVAVDDTAIVLADVGISLDVLANDDDVESDPLSVFAVTPPANGTTVVNADETITYTPDPGYTGPDSFVYTVSDGTDTDSATVDVMVVSAGAFAFDFFGTPPASVPYVPSVGTAVFSVPLLIQEDTGNPGFPNGIQAFTMELEHDPLFLAATAVSEGAALLALGGAEQVTIDIQADRIVVDVIVSSTGAPLFAATPQEALVVDYDGNPAGLEGNPFGASTSLVWAPGAANSLTLGGGIPVMPTLTDLPITFDADPLPDGFHFLAPGQTVLYDPVTGAASFSESVFIEEGPGSPGFPTGFEGFSMGLAHDPALLIATSVVQGPALTALNGGTGPDLFVPAVLPDGITVGTVFDFSGMEVLEADTPQEVIQIGYDTVTGPLAGNPVGAFAFLSFSDDLGSPPVLNLVAVEGFPELATGSAGDVSLVPGP